MDNQTLLAIASRQKIVSPREQRCAYGPLATQDPELSFYKFRNRVTKITSFLTRIPPQL